MRCASPPESVGARTVERQIAQAHEVEEAEPARELRHHVARDLALARRETQLLEVRERFGHRPRRDGRDVLCRGTARRALRASGAARGRPRTCPDRRRPRPTTPPRPFAPRRSRRAGRPCRSIRGTSRSASCTRTGADRAARSCARTSGTHARSSTARPPRDAAPRRASLQRPSPPCEPGLGPCNLDDAHHVAAEIERLRERSHELAIGGRSNGELGHRQLDVVLLEPIEPRPRVGRRRDAVDPQRRVAAPGRPVRELGVVALAADHERRQAARCACRDSAS